MVDSLKDKRVLLGVSGSIAAFKAVALSSELVKAGAVVDVVMTPNATRFVAPLSFEAIVHRRSWSICSSRRRAPLPTFLSVPRPMRSW